MLGPYALSTVYLQTMHGDRFRVSACDAHLADSYRMRTKHQDDGRTYVEFNRNNSTIMLHRAIMCPPSGKMVDHIDGDGMNCTRTNMRVCSNAQNAWDSGLRNG